MSHLIPSLRPMPMKTKQELSTIETLKMETIFWFMSCSIFLSWMRTTTMDSGTMIVQNVRKRKMSISTSITSLRFKHMPKIHL